MSSAWSQLEQMLTCAICLDKFKNPRLLPCQHSFCGDACMDGLVDYARRQIKCPECRAEHRIPYQGVQSLPLNVTLIRFLELHARITGEEPEPVPTFMEKCAICGEKVEGVQRCAHCDKKVCPECKEAHLDLLRREIARVNGQSRRSISKLREFSDTLRKAEEKLDQNHKSVRQEIEDSCKRLISDLQAKQKRLLDEVDSYVGHERKTIAKLKLAVADECNVLESNLKLADEKLTSSKLQWNDYELTEVKEIYTKAMEFVRLFDPEIGDYTRKVRFILVPEFEALRRRLCELGELKFSETAQSLIANSFQYCNATGAVAMELCQAAAVQQQHQQHSQHLNQQQQQQFSLATQQGAHGLAHSNSNTNLQASLGLGGQGLGLGGGGGGSSGSGQMLDLPNSLMRSQSDHRLASQFQARLKQQEAAAAASGAAGKNGAGPLGRYGSRVAQDYETDALRSRYAPPRASALGGPNKDYTSDLLRDWPRPSDNDSDVSFGSSIHFKSAFMRRKEKERQAGSYGGAYGSSIGGGDDDDDLTSEASYGGNARNVRFYDQQLLDQQQLGAARNHAQQPAVRVFDCKEVEHAPFSGVPKLDECPQLNTRLHQLAAKAIVDKKRAEEEGRRDRDLVESARQAMSKASERCRAERQPSEDELEKQKKQLELRRQEEAAAGAAILSQTIEREEPPRPPSPPPLGASQAGLPGEQPALQPQAPQNSGSASSSPATPTSASGLPGGRRSLYGQAVTEKSKRQLSSAIHDAATYTARRRSMASSRDEAEPGDKQVDSSAPPAGSTASSQGSTSTASGRRRVSRSGRSLTKQSSSADEPGDGDASAPATPPATRRRRTLLRGESSASSTQRQQSVDSTSSLPKNSPVGSGGGGGGSLAALQDEAAGAARAPVRSVEPGRLRSKQRQSTDRQTTSTTTEDEDDDDDEHDDEHEDQDEGGASASDEANTGTIRRAKLLSQRSGSSASGARSRAGGRPFTAASRASGDDDDEDRGGQASSRKQPQRAATIDTDDDDSKAATSASRRNSGNRRSREFLPTYVNKLLDRSAQIRRDSQEQRSRGDSPQRDSPGQQARAAQSASSHASGYSSSPGTGSSASSIRQRLAYQRSQQHDDDAATNSSQSVYTTASSQRRSSNEDDSQSVSASSSVGRRPSTGSSTDRTVISPAVRRRELADDSASAYSRYAPTSTSSRRDSGDATGASSGGFQSRFLARSRTSAALSSSAGGGRSQDYSPSGDFGSHHPRGGGESDQDSYAAGGSARSYLSGRDRSHQASSGSGSAASASSTSGLSRTSATSGSGGSSAGKFTNLLAWRSMLRARLNSTSPQ